MKSEVTFENIYHCPICNDKTYIIYKRKDGSYSSKDCKCRTIRRNLLNLEHSGLKKEIKRCTFESYRHDEPWQKLLYNTIMKYKENGCKRGEWLYFGGQSGCGKTHLCTALIGELIMQGKACKYMRWQNEKRELLSCCNNYAEYSKLMRPIEEADVLYIDDLFIAPPTKAEIGLAFEIIDERKSSRKQTIITSNLILSEITVISEQIGGRIKEMCKKNVLEVGKDQYINMRLRGNEEKIF